MFIFHSPELLRKSKKLLLLPAIVAIASTIAAGISSVYINKVLMLFCLVMEFSLLPHQASQTYG